MKKRKSSLVIEIRRSKDGKFFTSIKSRSNGRKLFTSETYDRAAGARRASFAILRAQTNFAAGIELPVEEIDYTKPKPWPGK